MGGLERIASLVRAVRLGALTLALIAVVGVSWTAMQAGLARGPGPVRPAAINHAAAQARAMPSTVFVLAGGMRVNPACVTPGAKPDGSAVAQVWSAIPNPNTPFRGCPRP